MKKVAARQTDPDLKQMIDQVVQAGSDTFPVQLSVRPGELAGADDR
jgi:hypothetical protein